MWHELALLDLTVPVLVEPAVVLVKHYLLIDLGLFEQLFAVLEAVSYFAVLDLN